MKKLIAIILLILISLLIFFLQSDLFNWFNISGIKPNLFIILTLLIGLFIGNKVGVIFGFIIGIFIDVLTNQDLGCTSMMLSIIGLLGEFFDRFFSKDNKITIMLTTAGSTIIYELGMYVLKIVKYNITIEIIQFFKIASIESIYNVILVIILYPIIKRIGEYIEKTLKNKEFLRNYIDI